MNILLWIKNNLQFIIGCLVLIVSLLLLIQIINNTNKITEGYSVDNTDIKQYPFTPSKCTDKNHIFGWKQLNTYKYFSFSNASFFPIFTVPSRYNQSIINNILNNKNNFLIDCDHILYILSNNISYKYAIDPSSNNIVKFIPNTVNATILDCVREFYKDMIVKHKVNKPDIKLSFSYNSLSTLPKGVHGQLKIIFTYNYGKTNINNIIIVNVKDRNLENEIINQLRRGTSGIAYTSRRLRGMVVTPIQKNSQISNKYNIQITNTDGSNDSINGIALNEILRNVIEIIIKSKNIDKIIHSIYNQSNMDYPLYWGNNNAQPPPPSWQPNARFISGYISFNGQDYPTIAEIQLNTNSNPPPSNTYKYIGSYRDNNYKALPHYHRGLVRSVNEAISLAISLKANVFGIQNGGQFFYGLNSNDIQNAKKYGISKCDNLLGCSSVNQLYVKV